MNTINDKLQPLASNSMERADSDTLHCLLSATYFINFILKKNINYNVVLISSNIKSFFLQIKDGCVTLIDTNWFHETF